MAATDQVQIVVPTVESAPLDYTVPPQQAISPLAVNATFDGTGAGSAFLPTLELVSDSGHVIARCPLDSSVAAGGSAEVSWFPGVKVPAAAAGGGGVAWGFVQSPDIVSGGWGVQTAWDWNSATFTSDGGGVVTADLTSPTPLAVDIPASATAAWATAQASFFSTTNPATVSPDNVYAFIVPPWPNPLAHLVPNGLYSRFIDDQTSIFGPLQVRYALTSTFKLVAGGNLPYGLDWLNLDPAKGAVDLRYAWLGVHVVWM